MFVNIGGIEKNTCPVILIDLSGSTESQFNKTKTVRQYEFELANQICQNNNYTHAHIICWSTYAELFEFKPIDEFDAILKTNKMNGGTHLLSGLDFVHDDFLDQDKTTDIIIITDGEIQDGSLPLSEKLRNLCEFKINIHIVAVECGSKNYLTEQCNVGNTLYNMIRDNSMSRFINRFSIYNNLETEFVNLSNPTVPDDYAPFQDQMFKKTDFPLFVDHVNNLISEITASNNPNKYVQYLKLAHETSLSLYHMMRDKPYSYQMGLIDVFSNMYKNIDIKNDNNDISIYEAVRKLLLTEIDNHISGKTSTFTDLLMTKQSNLENAKIALMENVCSSITEVGNESELFLKTSFLLRDIDNMYMVRSMNDLVNITMGKITYNNAGINITNKQHLPVMFNPNKINGHQAALHWLLLHYARVTNLSPYNDYLIYYFLVDAYIVLSDIDVPEDIKTMYKNYVQIVLENKKDVLEANQLALAIPDNIFESIISYSQINVDKQILCDFIDDQTNISNIMVITMIDVNDSDKYVINTHNFMGLNVSCANSLSTTPSCITCGNQDVTYTVVQQSSLNINLLSKYYFDDDRHVNLGLLTGEYDNELITPTVFTTEYDSVSINQSNIMIVDSINSSSMKIKDINEFNTNVHTKYPFLENLDMHNVILAGGFVRSILLKQTMKDFDFFFYGMDHDNYIPRFTKLVHDLITSVKTYDKELKFGMFFKPQFNVFEIICFTDPTNHINEDFTLDNFDQYHYQSLRKYYDKSNQNKNKDRSSSNDEYYFEDNDTKGIRMKYRFQFIMCRYDSIMDIFQSFDMIPSKVAYDGNHVYFTKGSLKAYRYMINEVNLDGGSDLFKHRLNKYFKYGFSIVFPPTERNFDANNYGNMYNVTSSHNENVGPLTFKVRARVNNMLIINHDSNNESILERKLELETKALEANKALYTSNLFCSFVSILRYVKINNIDYVFLQNGQDNHVQIPVEYDEFIFKTGKVKLAFIDKYHTTYEDRKWYNEFTKSIILTNY